MSPVAQDTVLRDWVQEVYVLISLPPLGLLNRCLIEVDLFFLPVSLISAPILHSQGGFL